MQFLFAIGMIFFLFIMFKLWSISGWLVFLLFLVIIVGVILLGRSESKEQQAIKDKKEKLLSNIKNVLLEDFTVTKEYITNDQDHGILIDEDNKKVCIVWQGMNRHKVFNYRDILESEIIEDGETITKSSRKSQIGGALLGGVLAGGVGAIIGGLSGKQKSDKEIISLDLKLVVNNTQNPVYTINFLKAEIESISQKPIPIKKSSSQYKLSKNKINHWHSLITVLIKQADEEDNKQPEPTQSTNSNSSTADEIRKLSELLNDGFITQEEFNSEKQKVLSQGS
ncbi:SHOCT domain-containing protein [Alkalibacillus aidingensis]|uniref:SHOCT domain-containing protein n=1 Tax=Alkalibacillus aidingensis TaxID=2747607 RepID=UPI00166013BA|nr:SHOCT domain-containing protein [Alkalibacillus aidingensis]